MAQLTLSDVPPQRRPDDLDDIAKMRWVLGFEGHYSVASNGDVYSYKNNCWGTKQKPDQLSPTVAKNGYKLVSLRRKGQSHKCYVHRIVCEAFHGPRPTDNHETRHLNGDKLDNRACNLRWGTPLENSDDARRHGTLAKGEQNGTSKLTENAVKKIRESVQSPRVSQSDLAEKYDVSQGLISHVVNRDIWTHV